MSITINEAQKRLACLWGIGAAAAFVLLLWVSFGAHVFKSESVSDAWNWLLPLVMPFLTLIVTSVVSEVQQQNPSTAPTSGLALGLAWWISLGYILLTIGSLLAVLWLPAEPVALLKTSNLWLTPIQTLLSAAMGVFFTQRRQRASLPNGTP
jgi:hypothetical protein